MAIRWKQILTLVCLCGVSQLTAAEPLTKDQEKELAEYQRYLDERDQAYDEYMVYIGEITNQLAEQMEKELGLISSGTQGSMDLKINVFGVNFTASRRATIEEARGLQLSIMNRLVELVNKHEKIQPFLEERPFTYRSVAMGISFNEMTSRNSDGSITYIFNAPGWEDTAPENRNHLFYHTHDPFKDDLVDLFQEHYEDAIKLAAVSPLKYPYAHVKTEEERAIDEVFVSFNSESPFGYNVRCLKFGEKKNNDKIEEIGLLIHVFGRYSQESARELGVTITESLLDKINAHPILKSYLKEIPFDASHLKMRINFSNPRYCSYKDGSIESLVLDNNENTYYQDLPIPDDGPEKYWSHKVSVFAKESYPEARKLAKKSPSPAVKLYLKTCDYISDCLFWFYKEPRNL